jgi:SAM-dependent methyltransferase
MRGITRGADPSAAGGGASGPVDRYNPDTIRPPRPVRRAPCARRTVPTISAVAAREKHAPMNLQPLRRALARWRPRFRRVAPLPPNADPRTLAPQTVVPFRCNLCGKRSAVALAALDRERPSCERCGSNVRLRAMAHLLVTELFGEPAILPELPVRRDLVGIGLSDDLSYARPLARKLGYHNTWFHTEPRLDIADVPAALEGRYDFLLASDVFEHVAPPVGRAFVNARRLLKPGGVFVFSAPFSLEDDTVEHFPELHDFRLFEESGGWRLRNRTADGRLQLFDRLVFHGGPGTTLEMRLFSRAAVLREFAAAGFAGVRVAAEPYLPFGIVWLQPWSVPMVARA